MDAGSLCDKTAVLGDMIKRAFSYLESFSPNFIFICYYFVKQVDKSYSLSPLSYTWEIEYECDRISVSDIKSLFSEEEASKTVSCSRDITFSGGL